MKGTFYVFTRRDKWGSKLISWGTKYPGQEACDTPSHFATMFNFKWIIHSTMAEGVEMDHIIALAEKQEIIAVFMDSNKSRSPSELAEEMMMRSRGSGYDYLAVLYYAYRKLLEMIFKIPLPLKNKMQSASKWFCNEMWKLNTGEDVSMKSPNDMYHYMHEHARYVLIDHEKYLRNYRDGLQA